LGDVIRFATLEKPRLKADFDGDNDVDVSDLATMAGSWLKQYGSAITNPSFETPVLADGAWQAVGNAAPAPGWDNNMANLDDAKIINLDAAAVLAPTDGSNVLELVNGAVGNVAQFVNGYSGSLIESNTTYTVKVDVGVDDYFQWFQVKFVRLNDSGALEILEDLPKVNQNTLEPASNVWTPVEVTFDSSTRPETVGWRLIVVLEGGKIFYDNVRFSIYPQCDIDKNTIVNLSDFKTLAEEWLKAI
jgi:hypothetical protein